MLLARRRSRSCLAKLVPIAFAAAALAPCANATDGAPQQATHRKAGTTLRDRVLVKVSANATPRVQVADGKTGIAELDDALAALGARGVKPVFHYPPRGRALPSAAQRIGIDRWLHVDLGSERADVASVVAKLKKLRCVEIAETDRAIEPTVIPDDPDYGPNQWDLKSDKIDAESAWDTVTDSSALVVFVIDTGVETTHDDIVDNLWSNPGEIPGDGVDNEGNGFVDDVHGWNFELDDADLEDHWPHGMHVNGIIGAEGNNTNKVAGINWRCQLAQAKIFDNGGGTWEGGAAATTYAADNGGRVTNNSWGDTAPGPQVFEDAAAYADSLDLLQVAAAGNEGNTNAFWPAAYAQFLSVASTDSGDNLSWFSTHGNWIDMAAPGESIWNLWIGNSQTWLSGTSMASPHVCGAGALLRTVNPQLTNLESRVALRLATDDLGTPGYDDSFGFGRLDVKKAVDAAAAISLSTRDVARPGSVTISLSQPGEANMTYVLMAGISDIVPGLQLSTFDPLDFRTLPLEFDAVTNFCLYVQPNPILDPSIGTLDGNGQAQATFHVIGGPVFKDRTVSLVYVTFDPADLNHVRFISAPTSFHVH
ncbi:MAG TPA: S8 family serine peptidase [Planctomycetota bacterium]|jgi:subtilisin family serine protease|nr:S8 family serine peptidase [Planctomycetota bacterium]